MAEPRMGLRRLRGEESLALRARLALLAAVAARKPAIRLLPLSIGPPAPPFAPMDPQSGEEAAEEQSELVELAEAAEAAFHEDLVPVLPATPPTRLRPHLLLCADGRADVARALQSLLQDVASRSPNLLKGGA